ncbi:hypothetical protein K474DRAFT_1603049 [Panus rudis PR-1116 ss-1]|nr:hypothetical protein K474DRAFT_1603049 [Panus rudis PR-1116 ss-1]
MIRKPRSTLTDHSIPAFYACYLLKSIQKPRSNATYIGSTPHPPRRIRQHNGLISQGAWKTKNKRPWVMQMIVHGFPSKLAALQFEWAWQHPHISRHLKDDSGKAVFSRDRRNRLLKQNVQIARNMVCSHPYNTWPLYVKLFTEEAVKAWNLASKNPDEPPLPPGLNVVVELEGVDGQSGMPGTGRSGPIDVTDEVFTTAHLKKASQMMTTRPLTCSICHDEITNFVSEPLNVALCPAEGCTSVSHLRCLASDFLQQAGPSSKTDIIPRGGACKSCNTYTLWGDVIRGCYRRLKGGAIQADEEPELEGEIQGDQTDALASDDDGIEATVARTKSTLPKQKRATVTRPRSPVPGPSKAAKPPSGQSSPEEFFDLNAISSDDESDGVPKPPVSPQRRKKAKTTTQSTKVTQPLASQSNRPFHTAASLTVPLATARARNAAPSRL